MNTPPQKIDITMTGWGMIPQCKNMRLSERWVNRYEAEQGSLCLTFWPTSEEEEEVICRRPQPALTTDYFYLPWVETYTLRASHLGKIVWENLVLETGETENPRGRQKGIFGQDRRNKNIEAYLNAYRQVCWSYWIRVRHQARSGTTACVKRPTWTFQQNSDAQGWRDVKAKHCLKQPFQLFSSERNAWGLTRDPLRKKSQNRSSSSWDFLALIWLCEKDS